MLKYSVQWLRSDQSLSRVRLFATPCVQLFATPWTAAHQASLSTTNSQSLCKLMSIESVMPSNHLILCRPLLLLPSIFPSIRVFSDESVLCIRWPKYWSFSLSISPSNDYSGLISFRTDWLDLLAVQGTPKSLLQQYISKASILRHSAFFIVQLSHPYMTTRKTIALTRQTFLGKVMSLLFNMLSRLLLKVTQFLKLKRKFQLHDMVAWKREKKKHLRGEDCRWSWEGPQTSQFGELAGKAPGRPASRLLSNFSSQILFPVS